MYIDIEQMVHDWLKKNGADGLTHQTEPCGCGLDNLFPCDYDLIPLVCCAARKSIAESGEWAGREIYTPIEYFKGNDNKWRRKPACKPEDDPQYFNNENEDENED